MIKYDYEITVNGNQAKLNKDIYLFRGNKNVHYYFAVKNASFNFKGSTDLIEKTNAINAAVTVIKPNNVEVASAIAKVENGKIHLKVTEDLIDEEVEVGDFDLVFDLFDDTDGAVTIPKVIGQFHVLERPCTTPISELVATNTTNEVDQALTDYAIVTYAEPVASTNEDGTFAKKTWVPKEKITTAELNRMEEGISDVSSQCKDISNLSLTKHTDGKVYIKKQDGTLLGTGIEIGGSDVDLSKITMSMSGQTLKLMNGNTQIATVEIPTAVVTDEQLTSIIQSKIDDGTLTNMLIADNSITPQKTDFFNVTDNTNSVIETTWGDGGYRAKKSDYLKPLDEMYLCVDAPKGGGNEVQILFYDSSKTLISTYTPDSDFYDKNRETIFTSPIDGSSNDYAYARKVTIKLPIKELKPEGTSSVAVISKFLGTDEIPQLKTTLNNKTGKYISLNEKYNNDLIKNIDISNTNFKTISNNSLLNYKKVATDSTDFPGNNVLYFVDYIDTSVNKEIYIRFATNGSTQITSFSDVALYDENKQYIKTVYANPGSDTSKEKANFAVMYNDMALEPNKELENGEKVKTITIVKLTVPDEAKYIRFGNIDLYIRQFAKLWNFLYVSYKSITNVYRMTDSYNVEINIDFKKLVNECIDAKTEKTMVCIGDSLTNWGGGNDSSSGFLKVVHDKTGVMTDNRGKAGAWWQIQNNDESLTGTSAVNRVDYIVHNNEKFDLYCFIMGSNAGSSTDTGETSSNKTTMCGAIRYCMEKLKAHDPTAQILVCLPPQRAEGNDGQLLVNEVIKKIVEDEYSVRTLDLYRHSGVVPNTTIADINYLSDGLHLGSNGQTAIGNVLASEVKYMLCL